MTLVEGIEFLVVGEDEVCVAAQSEAFGRHTSALEHVHFGDEHPRVHDDPVADNGYHVFVEDATRDELKGEGLSGDHKSVAGVVATLVTDDHGHVTGQKVGELALALVTPLRPDYNGRGHGNPPDS